MKILVTGGAGYLGAVLVPMLLEQGHRVTVLDNFMFNQTSLCDVVWKENLRVIRGDVRDKTLMERLVVDQEAIILLACLVGAPICQRDPYTAQAVNLESIKLVCQLRKKDQLLLYPCTNSGYGIGQKDLFCDETTPLRPISFYGKLKVEAEQSILQAGGVTFRFATLFGVSPKMRLDLLVNDFVYRAVNDKTVVLFQADYKRNYLHVRDGARVFLHGIKNYRQMQGQAFNVGLSDANLSKEELCAEIKKIIPDFVYLRSEIGEDQDQRNYIVSNKKIEQSGFAPDFSLSDGIEELVKGFEIINVNQFRNI